MTFQEAQTLIAALEAAGYHVVATTSPIEYVHFKIEYKSGNGEIATTWLSAQDARLLVEGNRKTP